MTALLVAESVTVTVIAATPWLSAMFVLAYETDIVPGVEVHNGIPGVVPASSRHSGKMPAGSQHHKTRFRKTA